PRPDTSGYRQWCHAATLIPCLCAKLRKVWTCPNATLARESRHIVAFGLSHTTSRAADSSSAYFLQGVQVGRPQGCQTTGLDSAAAIARRASRRSGHELDRRARRTPEKTVVGRPFGQPDRRRTRRHYPQCGYRQGASPWPVRTRQKL